MYYDLILDYFLNKCDQKTNTSLSIPRTLNGPNIDNRLLTLIPIQDD